jgi:hypothetical protein
MKSLFFNSVSVKFFRRSYCLYYLISFSKFVGGAWCCERPVLFVLLWMDLMSGSSCMNEEYVTFTRGLPTRHRNPNLEGQTLWCWVVCPLEELPSTAVEPCLPGSP